MVVSMEERKIGAAEVGKLGELIAADFLIAKGYELVEQNKRYKTGEIDLIMTYPKRDLCFVEVKTKLCSASEFENNKTSLLQAPTEQLHAKKIRKLHKAISLYIQNSSEPSLTWQLDAVVVLYCKDTNTAYCKHLEHISVEL